MPPPDPAILAHDHRVRLDLEVANVLGTPVPLLRLGRLANRAEPVALLSGRLGRRSDRSLVVGIVVALLELFEDVPRNAAPRLTPAASRDDSRLLLRLLRLVLLQRVADMDIVPLDDIAHPLRLDHLGNLLDVVMVLLRALDELALLLLVPRRVTERGDRDFAQGGDRVVDVALLLLDERDGAVEDVDAAGLVHARLLDALEKLGERLVRHLVCRAPDDLDRFLLSSRDDLDDCVGGAVSIAAIS